MVVSCCRRYHAKKHFEGVSNRAISVSGLTLALLNNFSTLNGGCKIHFSGCEMRTPERHLAEDLSTSINEAHKNCMQSEEMELFSILFSDPLYEYERERELM